MNHTEPPVIAEVEEKVNSVNLTTDLVDQTFWTGAILGMW